MVSALIAQVQGPQPRKGGGRKRHAYRPARVSSRTRRGRRPGGAHLGISAWVAALWRRPDYGNPVGSIAVERATRAGGRASRGRDEPARVGRAIVELTAIRARGPGMEW